MQGSEHSSVEDAQAAMAVYRAIGKEWEERLRLKRLGHEPAPRRKQRPSGTSE